jgi:hypothetical protein
MNPIINYINSESTGNAKAKAIDSLHSLRESISCLSESWNTERYLHGTSSSECKNIELVISELVKVHEQLSLICIFIGVGE